MKKFICMMMCVMILVLTAGCAKTVRVETSETTTVVETEFVTNESSIEASTTSLTLQEFEQSFIDNFGEDNVNFQYSDKGDTYFIGIFVDFSFSTFYNMDGVDETCAKLNKLCAVGHEISGLDTFLTLYSRIDGVVYASYNGADFTMEAITVENSG